MLRRNGPFGPILVLAGVFLITRGHMFAGVALIIVGSHHLRRGWRFQGRSCRSWFERGSWSDPGYWQRSNHELSRRIQGDAHRYQCSIPYDEFVHESLRQVYAKYFRLSQAYPQLAQTYDELVDSMWAELRATTSLSEWRRIVREVSTGWPSPFAKGESPLADSLRKAQHVTRQWREAQREAGGSPAAGTPVI
jgi:hypothetical protein